MNMQTGVQTTGGTRSCVSCGRSIDWNVNVCPYCGHDYRRQMFAAQQPTAKGRLAGWGGGLIIASGILGVVMGIAMILVSTLNFSTLNITLPTGFTEQDLKNLFVVLGSAFSAFGVVAIIGGIFAVQRRHLAVSIIGGVFGIFSVGVILGAVLALIGIVILIMARNEFGQAPAPPAYQQPPSYGAPPPSRM